MHILKLIFHHDRQVDSLGRNHPDRGEQSSLSLEDFMKPIPTYSKFYLSNTVLESDSEPHFGFTTFPEHREIFSTLTEKMAASQDVEIHDETVQSIWNQLEGLEPGEGINLTAFYDDEVAHNRFNRDQLFEIQQPVEDGAIIVFKENAHHGFDLHYFMRDNLYEIYFHTLKEYLSDNTRFFSINGKRVGSERTFYFETHRLDRPPHGFEEVFPETSLFGE